MPGIVAAKICVADDCGILLFLGVLTILGFTLLGLIFEGFRYRQTQGLSVALRYQAFYLTCPGRA